MTQLSWDPLSPDLSFSNTAAHLTFLPQGLRTRCAYLLSCPSHAFLQVQWREDGLWYHLGLDWQPGSLLPGGGSFLEPPGPHV